MWWRNSLCTSADEGLGTLAEYDPLTFPEIPGVSGGLFWWHTVTEFPGLRQQQQRHPTPSAPAANVSSQRRLGFGDACVHRGIKLASRQEALEDRRGTPDTAPGEVGRSPCAVHRSCTAVSLARRFPGPPWAVGAIPEAAHLSSAGNFDSSMPRGPERGVGSGPESNVGASLGEALAALLQRGIRQPDFGCEVSAPACLFHGRIGEDRLVKRW